MMTREGGFQFLPQLVERNGSLADFYFSTLIFLSSIVFLALFPLSSSRRK
jgi:hypothetical protein